jgi:hypothetical protein
MDWGGNLPECCRASGKNENDCIVEQSINAIRQDTRTPCIPDTIRDGVLSNHAERQPRPSQCRAAAAQSGKSASDSTVVQRRGAGERSERFLSVRCRRIFSMTHGLSMRLRIRK